MSKYVAVLAFLMCGSANAILSPCSLTGVDIVPANPSTTDAVSFRVGLAQQIIASAGSTMFARATASGNIVTIDVIAKDTATPVAGYELIGSTTGQGLPNANDDASFGSVGPLATGTYDRVVTVNSSSQEFPTLSCQATQGSAFTVSAQSGPVATAPVVEFYNATLDHYFVTQHPQEIADLDSGVHAGWVRTGQSFLAYLPASSDNRGKPTCRWYASPAAFDTHFFSASTNECRNVRDSYNGIWKEETQNAFEIALPNLLSGACPSNTTPVYRLWNARADSNHRYTTSLQIRSEMLARGFVAEGYGDMGVAMCAVGK